MKKVPITPLLIIGWFLVALFTWFAFFYQDIAWISNLASDAFGAALSVVLIGTISLIYFRIRGAI